MDLLDKMIISDRYMVEFDKLSGALWSTWGPVGKPCFETELLEDLRIGCKAISDGTFEGIASLRYFILTSAFPGIFNMGGDLELFYQLASNKDYEKLKSYGMRSLQSMLDLQRGFGKGVTTIALVEGKCFGGGFETALSCDYLIADRSATFCFPEIMLGIFPGMGAVSILARKVTRKNFEELLHTGRTFTAEELYSAGIVDHLVEPGNGTIWIKNFLKKRDSAYSAHKIMIDARKKINSISNEEVEEILNSWIQCVLGLTPRKLNLLLHAAEKQSIS